MVNEIGFVNHRIHNEYLEKVFEIYAAVASFYNLPKVHQIYGSYSTQVDGRVMALQAEVFPDDFYDGSPDKKAQRILPDYIKDNIRDYIKMPEDVTEEIIIDILEDHEMFYIHRGVGNSPIIGVW